MPIQHNILQCTHIKLNGYRCGSPALTGQRWCYFHARMRRGTKARLDAAVPALLVLEDAESIQGALMQIIDMLLLDQIEVAKARLILRAIEIASRNVKNLDLKHHQSLRPAYQDFRKDMVRDLVMVEEPEDDDGDEDEANDAEDGGSAEVDEGASVLPEPIWCEIDPGMRKGPGKVDGESGQPERVASSEGLAVGSSAT